jgi:transposase InsO family protein
LKSCSSLSSSPMTDDALSTLTSRLIPQRHGPHSKCSKPFRSTPAPKYLLRDRDCIYGQEFRKQVEVMNINEVLSTPRSPWQCAYVEHVIGSIRRECLDHMIIFDEDSLRRALSSYFSYYHRSRLHLSLGKDSPDSRPVQSIGKITAFPEVGGLHHRYGRVA